jgi:hypothetical protein
MYPTPLLDNEQSDVLSVEPSLFEVATIEAVADVVELGIDRARYGLEKPAH